MWYMTFEINDMTICLMNILCLCASNEDMWAVCFHLEFSYEKKKNTRNNHRERTTCCTIKLLTYCQLASRVNSFLSLLKQTFILHKNDWQCHTFVGDITVEASYPPKVVLFCVTYSDAKFRCSFFKLYRRAIDAEI